MASSVTPVVWGRNNQHENTVLGTNPSARLFTYSNSDYRLLDYSHYSLDITEANKGNNNRQSKKKELADKQSKKKELVENVHNSRRKRDAVDPTLASTSTTEEMSKEAASSNSSAIPTESPAAEVNPTTQTSPSTMVDPVPTTMTSGTENTNVTLKPSEQEAKDEDVNKLVAKWKLLYNATTAFNVTDLSPTSMFLAVEAMVASGARGSLFQAYYRQSNASSFF